MYAGAAIVDAPTPSPPMNLKNANVQGSLAKADPTADMVYSTPIHIKVFLRPILLVGIPPKKAPTTVPQSAMPITTTPWNISEEPHNSCSFFSAPEITTVSKPNRKPASAAVMDQISIFLFIAWWCI
ncbi:MAG: hypothetical protein TRG1_2378 [Flavobacteriaceae bacterium FS1-H7996/R]|nr:MAG: hypothetical protein TRG1_2378 [Flavobacteriaceae bacterium FS1-H7996/R]